MIIGCHVPFTKDSQLLGSLKTALEFNANTFMFYTGAPQNTLRTKIDKNITLEARKLMQEKKIDINNCVVHAPYIINLANDNNLENFNFAKQFLKDELKRCEELGISKLVLHPGSHVGLGISKAKANIIMSLNEVLIDSKVTILLETMAGKGTEVGSNLEEIKDIIAGITNQDRIGICLDTCHLSDAGYDIKEFDKVVKTLEDYQLLDKVKCLHINDSKNPVGSHKDRHENLGYGNIGFSNLLKVVYHEKFKNIPKILETPYIEKKPPYKEEIAMLKDKKWHPLEGKECSKSD